MGIRIYKILPAQAKTPDHITTNVRYNVEGNQKIVEFTQLPNQSQGLLSHGEALALMGTSEWLDEEETPIDE